MRVEIMFKTSKGHLRPRIMYLLSRVAFFRARLRAPPHARPSSLSVYIAAGSAGRSRCRCVCLHWAWALALSSRRTVIHNQACPRPEPRQDAVATVCASQEARSAWGAMTNMRRGVQTRHARRARAARPARGELENSRPRAGGRRRCCARRCAIPRRARAAPLPPRSAAAAAFKMLLKAAIGGCRRPGRQARERRRSRAQLN